jgi:hypothetical protein
LVINGLIVGQKSFDLENDVNKMYSDFEEAFIQTVDKHAPVKQIKPCQNPAPFINKELRKAVKEIIKTFCYHVLIIYDFILFRV